MEFRAKYLFCLLKIGKILVTTHKFLVLCIVKSSTLLSLTAILVGAFSLVCLKWEIVPNRWLRAFTGLIFLLFALQILSFKRLLGLATFGLLVLCDFFLIFWEFGMFKHAYYVFHGMAMLIMLLLTVRELKRPKISAMEGIFLTFFFIVISAILILLGSFFDAEMADLLLQILFYLNGFLLFFW